MSLELTLHRSLYSTDAVRAAAAAFGALATVTVLDRDHELLVTFSDVDPDVQEVLLDAFANHALFETTKQHASQTPPLRGAAEGVVDG